MKIRIDVDGGAVMATLDNNSQAAKDFIALLPLTLTLNDYNATEKVSDLPRRLSTKDAPPGFDPSIGDIAYYAPWGNLAIFYKDFGISISSSAGLAAGFDFVSAYAASKFGLEGWLESLQAEVAPFGWPRAPLREAGQYLCSAHFRRSARTPC